MGGKKLFSRVSVVDAQWSSEWNGMLDSGIDKKIIAPGQGARKIGLH